MSFGKISIKKTAEQVALVKQLGSKNKAESMAAQEVFAAFIGDVILQVVEQAPVISNLYTSKGFAEGTAPSLPLDVLFDIRDRNYIQVFTQSAAGGVPTSYLHGLDELMVSTYNLSSAVSFGKKYAREARLDVVAAIMERMAQEILVKQEINGASILCKASADARYDVAGVQTPQIIRSQTADLFSLGDLNRLMTLAARSRPSWAGGTPVGGNSLTDLIGSPEYFEQIRAISYQPVNTRAGSLTTNGATSIAATDSVRDAAFNGAGLTSFFGVNLTQVYEMGVGRSYNTLFSSWIGATTFQGYAQGANAAFAPTTEEQVIGLNLTSPNVLVRLVQESDGGGRLNVQPDDSFPSREDKLGFYASSNEGRVMLDTRAVVSCVF